MIKKVMVFGIVVLLFANFAFAADEPELYNGVSGSDAEQMGQTIDNNIPIDDNGEFDPTKFTPIKSKAEMRIDAINKWLADNASWLSFIFGMVPAISWVFALNLYLMLLFISVLIFNGESVFLFLEGSKAKIMGAAVFVILWMTKSIVWLSNLALDFIGLVWNWILPIGFWAAVLGMVLVGIGLIALAIFAPQVLVSIGKMVSANKEKKAKAKTNLDREELHTEVEAIRKNSS